MGLLDCVGTHSAEAGGALRGGGRGRRYRWWRRRRGHRLWCRWVGRRSGQ